MTLEEYESYKQAYLWDLSFNGAYLGFALEEEVMKKLVKLKIDYEAKIREILLSNQDKIHMQGWTLNSDESRQKGHKQTSVFYTESNPYRTKEQFIKNQFSLTKPTKKRYFLNVENMDKATELIDFELDNF